jgi:translation initiation factor 4A
MAESNIVKNDEINTVEINDTENIYSVEKWDELKISENLLRGIYSYGFENPSEIQKKSIAPIIEGRDIIAQAQSGMGKTGAFSIGTLQRIDISQPTIQAVLLAPTHELVKQTQKVIQSLGSQIQGLKVKTLIGGTSIQDDTKDIRENCPHIIVGCAGRVYDMFRRRYINGRFIKIMVLDEADVMLSTGFNEQIYNLFQYLPENIQVAIFSATLPPDILLLTEKFMRNPVKITMAAEKLNLECIKQYYIALRHDNDKFEVLKDLFSYISLSQCIIYCNSVRRVSDLYQSMIADGFSVCCIHSSMDRIERDREFQEFRSGKYRVLISSNVTARGIDIQQVSTVINFDIPKDEHTYLHRIGRSGRWGRKGMAINFVTKFDIHNMKRIEEYYKINIDELPANFSGDPMDT